MRSLQLISRGDLLTPCFSLSRASHCWELLTAKARSLSLSGASYCWEAARCGEAHRCRELLIGGRRRTIGRLLTVRSFSLSGVSHCLGASCCWEATSHCQEFLNLRGWFGGISPSGASHCWDLLIVWRRFTLGISATRVASARIVASPSLS